MRISDWSSDVCSSDLSSASRQRAIGQWFPAADARLASIAEPDELVERDLRLLRPVGARQQPFTPFPLLPTVRACQFRSEERRGGEECVGAWSSRWSRNI